ncbi:hypothetical protein [Paludibacterium paludis]|uniref:Uncharacterized protein n=1 Tax=Paludibacterium paludis TaxID=1225769 RepID=A0A918P6V9_9NEIS|nr:hypothetical protein [Paludibacterium paludis]GGY28424.1 hypothetical protein GCM10011289_34600 [Paludibacterium paludis]
MRVLLLLPIVLSLSACNWLTNVTGLSKDANKAIGAACRQTGRSLEECYLRNPDADKAAIYAGWREMQEYMVKQKLGEMERPAEPVASAPAAQAPRADASRSAAASAPQSAERKHLTSEEADRMAKNDPQVEAVLAAIKKQNASDSKKRAGHGGENRKILNLINELNQKDGRGAAKPEPKPAE